MGTGLFVGSGAALHTGGPVGLLLGYIIMGTVMYSMVVALGEMTTLFPVSGSFVSRVSATSSYPISSLIADTLCHPVA
jgi:amino acid permease